METIGLLGMLGICTYEDIRKKQVEVLSVLAFGILGVLIHMINQSTTILNILGGMAIGLVVYVISLLSKEKIGKGDALIIAISGIYIGFWDNLILFWGATTIAGMIGLIYIAFGRRNKELPFVPFLFITYVGILILKGDLFVS